MQQWNKGPRLEGTTTSEEGGDIESTALGKGRSWWYILTSWHFIREPLGTSGLKEGTAEAAGEK
jgi:hypothetical protein